MAEFLPGREALSAASRGHRPSWLLWLVPLGLLGGCGGNDGRVAVHPVQGRILVLDQIPEGALVVFYPAPGNPTELRPSGKVGPDGAFKLTSYDADDGAPQGEFIGTIRWNKVIKKGSDYVAGPDLVPTAYSGPETSPWKIRVAATPNDLPELTIKK